MYILAYTSKYVTKAMGCQTSCRSRLRYLRQDTNCGTAYEHCSPVAGGYYGLSDAVTHRVEFGSHNHTLTGQ